MTRARRGAAFGGGVGAALGARGHRLRLRSGIGIPALVAVLIAVVALVQLSQHLFTGQVVVQASRALAGRVAWQTALGAVREARALVVSRSARPGTQEFALSRGQGARFLEKSAIALGPSDLPDTARLIQEAHGGNVELVSITATLEPRRLLLARDFDHEGVLEIEAHVRSRLESVERRVFRSWSYKVVHLAPGSELENVVGMVRAPDRVLRGRHDANQLARSGIESDLPALIGEVRGIVADAARQQASASNDRLKQLLGRLREIYSPLVQGAGGGTMVASLSALEPRWRTLPALPADARASVLVHRGTLLSPAEFDLQGDLDPLVTRHRQAREEAVRLGARVRALTTADEAALALHRSYRAALQALADAIAKEADRYLRFRETFVLLPPSGAEQAGVLGAYARLDPVARLADFPAAPVFDLAVCVLLDGRKLEPTPEESLRRTLARLSGPRGFFGTLLIENGDRPLLLTGALRGRFVLAANGPLTIENLTRADPASDLITIVHAADPSRPLTLSGRIDATVVASGARLTVRRGTSLSGGLFLEDVDPTSAIEPELTDPDRIALDPQRSGIDEERLRHVVFSPWTRTQGSARDRGLE